LTNVTHSPSYRQASAPKKNNHATLRALPDLCTNISLAVLYGKKVIHIKSLGTQISVYTHTHAHTHILHGIERCWLGKGNKKFGTAVNATGQTNLPVHQFAHA